jgi:hypothetical protein
MQWESSKLAKLGGRPRVNSIPGSLEDCSSVTTTDFNIGLPSGFDYRRFGSYDTRSLSPTDDGAVGYGMFRAMRRSFADVMGSESHSDSNHLRPQDALYRSERERSLT